MRIRLVLEYDGTDYCGFQRQPSAPSIQAELESKLGFVCGHPVEGVGAGRTDAGVHALGQVVHFDTTGRVPTERIPWVVNHLLSPALVVRHAEEAAPEFHARYGAARRTYDYYVAHRLPDPVLARYAVYDRLLLPDAAERMRASLPPLLGRHDFASFCSQEGGGRSTTKTTVRTVHEAAVEEQGDLLRFRIAADAFLHSMVRIIAGLLLEIGRGKREPEALGQALAARDRHAAAVTAPPHGLFLMKVEYPDGFPGETTPEAAPFWNTKR